MSESVQTMPKSRSRWFQISLKTLILLMLCAGTGFGLLATRMNRAQKQKEVVDALKAQECTVWYDHESVDGKKFVVTGRPDTWLRRQLGDDFFDRVVYVDFGHAYVRIKDDKQMRMFGVLPHLRYLNLTGSRITDVGATHLRKLVDLEFLDLWGSEISDDGMANLRRMTEMKELILGGAKNIEGPGLVHLKRMDQLTKLQLSHTNVDDQGLAHLRDHTNLTHLTLFGTRISDESVDTLLRLERLKYLIVSHTSISEEGLARLRNGLPDCDVIPPPKSE